MVSSKEMTYCEFVSGLETLWTNEDIHASHVEYLWSRTVNIGGWATWMYYSTSTAPVVTKQPLILGTRVKKSKCVRSLFSSFWTGGISSSEKRPDTNKRWFTRVIDVQQVTVEIQVGVLAHLHRRIGRFLGHGAGRESQLGIDGEWREGHFR